MGKKALPKGTIVPKHASVSSLIYSLELDTPGMFSTTFTEQGLGRYVVTRITAAVSYKPQDLFGLAGCTCSGSVAVRRTNGGASMGSTVWRGGPRQTQYSRSISRQCSSSTTVGARRQVELRVETTLMRRWKVHVPEKEQYVSQQGNPNLHSNRKLYL